MTTAWLVLLVVEAVAVVVCVGEFVRRLRRVLRLQKEVARLEAQLRKLRREG